MLTQVGITRGLQGVKETRSHLLHKSGTARRMARQEVARRHSGRALGREVRQRKPQPPDSQAEALALCHCIWRWLLGVVPAPTGLVTSKKGATLQTCLCKCRKGMQGKILREQDCHC